MKSKENPNPVTGTLEIIFEADDRIDAQEKADEETMGKASRIVHTLAFTFDEGIVLGDHYKVRPIDAPNKSKMDASQKAGEFILNIGSQVYENIDDKFSEDDELDRAINWYNLGLSTETDSLVPTTEPIRSELMSARFIMGGICPRTPSKTLANGCVCSPLLDLLSGILSSI